MSQFVDLEYYKNEFGGQTSGMEDADIQKNINRAELVVNSVTYQKLLTNCPFGSLSTFKQNNIKTAICLVTESYILDGGYLYSNKAGGSVSSGEVQGVSIGSFSYSKGAGKTEKSNDTSLLSGLPDVAYSLLLSTGLLYAGVPVYDRGDYYDC